MTKVIALLGNEREELGGTRHNVGFDIADSITNQFNPPLIWHKKYSTHPNHYQFAETTINGEKVYLVKPLAPDPKDRKFKTNDDGKFIKDENGNFIPNPSFRLGDINHSGAGLKAFLEDRKSDGEKIANSDIFVVCDDLSNSKTIDGARKTSRYSLENSNHNGIKNIAKFLGSGFFQVEIPVGKPEPTDDKPNFVLSKLDPQITNDFSQALRNNLPDLLAGNHLLFQKNFNQFLKTREEEREALQSRLAQAEESIKKEESEITKLKGKPVASEARLKELYPDFDDHNLAKIGGMIKAIKALPDQDKDDVLNLVFIKISEQRIREYKNFRTCGIETEFTKGTLTAPKQQQSKPQKNIKTPNIKQTLEEIANLKKLEPSDQQQKNLIAQKNKLQEELKKIFSDEKLTKEFVEHTPEILTFEVLNYAIKNKKLSILEIIIAQTPTQVLQEVDENKNSLLHIAINNNCGTEIIETLLNLDLSPDQKNFEGKTPIHLALEQFKAGLPNFYTMLFASKTEDVHLTDDYHKFAKENQKHYFFEDKDKVSELQSSRMPPAKLIKHHYDNRKKGLKIFTPYSDKNWSQFPKQTLEDFGANFVEPEYSIDDENHFANQQNLEKLITQIRAQVAQGNGLVILGNNGNIDQDFFKPGVKIDLTSPESRGNRRTFVEMVAYCEAMKLGKPIWGICGGAQMAATLCGGTIIQLEKPQNLRNNEVDKLTLEPHSIVDPNQYSNTSKTIGINSYPTSSVETWSAHYQGVKAICKDSTLPISERFEGLPEGIRVVATSETSPEIPKIYEHFITDSEGHEIHIALLAQNHLEADLSHNKVHRKIEEAFVDRCAENSELSNTEKDLRKTESKKLMTFIDEHLRLPLSLAKTPAATQVKQNQQETIAK